PGKDAARRHGGSARIPAVRTRNEPRHILLRFWVLATPREGVVVRHPTFPHPKIRKSGRDTATGSHAQQPQRSSAQDGSCPRRSRSAPTVCSRTSSFILDTNAGWVPALDASS